MTQIYRQSRRCDDAIKEEEGWRSKAYLDGAGVPTIAYGHTKNAKIGMVCTSAEGLAWYDEDMDANRMALSRLFPGKVFSQGQVDALISFIHNFGETKFRNYTLYRLIRDGASDHEISEKWLDYVYTIRDDDMDGDLDAMIDNGLPIRRYREMLMWNGFSYVTASAAANMSTLNLNDTEMTDWSSKGGRKEVFKDRIPASDIILKAHSARAVLGEGQPGKEPALTMGANLETDEDLFEEDMLPEGYEDMAPNEKTEYWNGRSLVKAGGEVEAIPAPPSTKPVEVVRRVNTVELDAVPYISNPAPKVKKMDESQRGKGFAKTQTAREVGVVGVAGTAATAVGAMEPAVKFVDKYPKETIAYVFFALLIASVVYYYYGKWQRQKGEDEAEDLLS